MLDNGINTKYGASSEPRIEKQEQEQDATQAGTTLFEHDTRGMPGHVTFEIKSIRKRRNM
jgi:hypothetical protein